jgi:ketosteroid isomerase-like protein
MSQENVEVVRRLHEAFLGGDYEAALACFADDAVTDMTVRPDGRLYHGPQGMFEAMAVWIQMWDDYRFEPEDYVDAGDERVVLLWTEYGRGKGSTAPVEIRGGTVWTVRGGKVVRVKPYTNRDRALEAVGLSE